jgi:hypothetical protein
MAVAALAVMLLGAGCASIQSPELPTYQPLPLHRGVSLTFRLAGQRFAFAAYGPPASLIVARLGLWYVWATPGPAMRDVFVQEVVDGRASDGPVLVVNPAGVVDYSCTFEWAH